MKPANRYAAAPQARKASDELIVRHAELVKRIAYHMAGRLPASVDVDDLIQAGMVGLMEAATNWSMNRGASFETYAGIRIRGAMIDALRKLDWAPRSVHRQARAVAAAVREIEQRTGREARDAQVAEHMGLTLDDYHQALQDAAICQLASLEDKAGDHFADDSDPFQDAANDEFRTALGSAIGNLPERERLVMSLYYSDGLNLKEIGAVLEVTESRACQLHGQALTRLRARLTDWRELAQEAGRD